MQQRGTTNLDESGYGKAGMMRSIWRCVLTATCVLGLSAGTAKADVLQDARTVAEAAVVADGGAFRSHRSAEHRSDSSDRSSPFRTVADIKRQAWTLPFLPGGSDGRARMAAPRSSQPAESDSEGESAASAITGPRFWFRRWPLPFQSPAAARSAASAVPSETGPPVPPRLSSVERPRPLRIEVTHQASGTTDGEGQGWQAASADTRPMRFELTARSRTLVVRGARRASQRAVEQREGDQRTAVAGGENFEPPIPRQPSRDAVAEADSADEAVRSDRNRADARGQRDRAVDAGSARAGTAEAENAGEHTSDNTDTADSQEAKSGEATGGAAEPAGDAPVDRELAELRERVAEAIDVSSRRYLTIDVHTPWQMMHGVLALRERFMIRTRDGELIPAVQWLRNGATFQGESIFLLSEDGAQGHPYTEPYIFQGHPCQFFAMLTMLNLPLDAKFVVQGREVTIADFVRHAKANVNDNEEVTWVLWSLSHYLPPDARWVNKYGEPWSIERLVRIETQNAVAEGACGGTHGLFALAYARNRARAAGRPLKGVWAAAQGKLRHYIERTRQLQNSDGSFSTEFYAGPGYSTDFETRIDATGHCLEWLMMALEDEELEQPWVRSAVRSLAGDLIENRQRPARCGPLYHSVHALVLFQERTSDGSAARQAAKTPEGAGGGQSTQ